MQRGCNKPGETPRKLQGLPFRFASPLLAGEGDYLMEECPVGYILREAPETFDIITTCGMFEHCSPSEYSRLPRYIQTMARVYYSEKDRIREVRDAQRKAEQLGQFGSSVRARRG